MSATYKISQAGFGWLSKAFADKNAISPFLAFEKYAGGFNEREKRSLISQGIISQDGTVSSAALAAFNVLLKSNSYSRIRILGTVSPVDKVTYFKGESSCSVDSGADGFTVTFPAMSKEAAFVFEEYTGSSRLINVPFSAALSPKAAAVLLALVDLHRANALRALAGRPEDEGFGVQEVISRVNGEDSFMSFVRSLKGVSEDISLSAADLAEAYKELKSKNFADFDGEKYQLADEALELARTFLIPEYVFNLSFGRMLSAKECEQSECYVIFCGMHNLLYIDKNKNLITIETMSGSELLRIIVTSLNENMAK